MTTPTAPRVPQAESGRYAVLDALRGMGAMQVVVYHYVWLTNSGIKDLPIVFNSWVSLEFFFVLSGFVIALVYGRKVHDLRSLMGFAVRRFGRIWPLHFVVLSSFVAMIVVINVGFEHPNWFDITVRDGRYSLESLVTEFFLWNAMGYWPETKWYVPAWSIGAEFYTYLVFGLVCLLAGRFLPLAAAVMAALSITVLVLYSPYYLFADANFGFFRCMGSFFTGVLAYHAHKYAAGRWIAFDNAPKTALGTFCEVGILVVVALFCAYLDKLEDIFAPASLFASAIFFCVVFIFSFERGHLSTLLSRSAFRKLGDLSFSMYATHWPIFILALFLMWQLLQNYGIDIRFYLANSRLISFLGFFPIFAVVLLVSRVTHNWVEVPSRVKFAAIGRKVEGAPARRPQPQAAA